MAFCTHLEEFYKNPQDRLGILPWPDQQSFYFGS